MTEIPMKHKGEVLSREVSSGVTIDANGYATVTDDTLAGKYFQGYAINSVSTRNVSVTQVYINESRFSIVIKNNGTNQITTGKIVVYYRD